jgi:hypothetical protein
MCLLKDNAQMRRQMFHLHNWLPKLHWLDHQYCSLFLGPQLKEVADNPWEMRSCYIMGAQILG